MIADTTDVFTKICMRFSLDMIEMSFPDYNMLVECYEKHINELVSNY